MKKALTLMLCVLLCASLLPKAYAAESRDLSAEETVANSLKELGLFEGTNSGFELDRRPTRAEALAMLLRALGLDAKAKTFQHSHPFTDVPEWADGI